MISRIRDLFWSAADRLPAVLVLAGLAGVGVVGYLNDWKLPRLFGNGASAGAKDEPESAAPSETSDSGDSTSAKRPIRLSAEAARKAGVETAAAAERPMARYVHAHGSFDYDPTRYARLGPRAAGVVWQVYRQPGEAVRRGDVLAVVEAAEVGRAKAAFLQSLAQAQAKEKSFQAVQAQAKVVPGAYPELSLREAEAQMREARARLFSDQQALFNLGLPIALEEVAALPEDKATRRLRLLGLPEPVARSLDADTATANLLPVTAPFDGVVVSRAAVLGEAASPERPLFVVADLRKVWLTCEVRLEDIDLLKAGQEIVVRPDGAAEDAPPGKLTRVGPEADEKTHTVQAFAEVPNAAGTLRPNTPFEGHIVVRRDPRAVAVPAEAVQWDGRSPLVFVRVSDEEYEPRPVQVGVSEGGYTEIQSGVAPGEVVVTRGSHVLKAEWLKDRIVGDD